MGNGERSFNCGKSSSFPCKEAIIETWKRKRGKKKGERNYIWRWRWVVEVVVVVAAKWRWLVLVFWGFALKGMCCLVVVRNLVLFPPICFPHFDSLSPFLFLFFSLYGGFMYVNIQNIFNFKNVHCFGEFGLFFSCPWNQLQQLWKKANTKRNYCKPRILCFGA